MTLARPVRARKSIKKVDAPVYIDRILKFNQPLHRFELILQWHPSLDVNPHTQRLGFKAAGNFVEAVERAQFLASMLNRHYGRTQKEIDRSDFCRLVAVYEEKSFKDYSQEPIYSKEARRLAIQKQVAEVKDYDKTVSTKIPRNTLRTVRVQ